MMTCPVKNTSRTCLINNTLSIVNFIKDSDPPSIEIRFEKLGVLEGKIAPQQYGLTVCDSILPALCDADDRVVGQPQCIGYNGRYAILRYITVGESFMKFLLIDTWTNLVIHVFSDFGRYFCKDLQDPLECLLEPVCSPAPPHQIRWILRLPQTVLTPFKWSKMFLYAHDLRSTETAVVSVLRDRRWQGVAFHPQGHQLCLSLVNTYGYKCKVVKMDASTLQIIGQRDFRSPLRLRNAEEEGTVTQSMLQYGHDGESIIVISCLTCSKGSFCLLQFDSLSLACLRCWRTTNIISIPVTFSDKIGISVSPCGSCLKLWQWDGQQGVIIATMALGKPSTLSSTCRTVIRGNIQLQDIPKLPLPITLQLFLMFHTPVPFCT